MTPLGELIDHGHKSLQEKRRFSSVSIPFWIVAIVYFAIRPHQYCPASSSPEGAFRVDVVRTFRSAVREAI